MTWRPVALPGDAAVWAERPVVRGATVALGMWTTRGQAATPVMTVLDLDGAHRFTITRDAGGREVVASEPAIDHRGIVRAAVYEHDVELAVYAAHHDGTRLPTTSLGAAYPLHASDVGAKLALGIAACDDDGFLVSYVYRQVRERFTGKYRDGDGRAIWSTNAHLAATTAGSVLVSPPASDGGLAEELVCLSAADGGVRWRRAPSHVVVAGTSEDALLPVDRATPPAEHAAGIAGAESAFLDDRATEADVEAAHRRIPQPPTDVWLVDAATGAPRWHAAVPGDVIAAQLVGEAVDVLARVPGAVVLHARAGERLAELGRVADAAEPAWPPATHRVPVLVGRHAGRALWADDTTLYAAPAIALPGELPGSLAGLHRRAADRWLTRPNAVVAAGRVYARVRDTLWIREL
jgi:hypothetical protein